MRVLALVLGLAAGCGATLATSTGTALVAPGTAGGTTASVRLYDRGGPVSRLVVRTLAAIGAANAAIDRIESTSSTSTSHECKSGSCATVTTITTTTTVYVDPVKAAAAQAAYERLDREIADTPYRDFPFETVLDVATRSLGGDTSGWNFWFWYHGAPSRVGRIGLSLSIGFAAGDLAFHDRTRTTLVGSSAAVTPVTAMVTPSHVYVGTPIRVTAHLRHGLSVYLQPDLNWASTYEDLGDDDDGDVEANPWRLGVRARWRGFELGGELMTDRMSAHARSLGAEVGYVF